MATTDKPPSPPYSSLKPNVDDLGINYFFRHFVFGARSNARGCLNYVPSVYYADGEQSTLVASMAAVGLVALANTTQRPELASHARVKYLQAIHLVSAALASPVECVKDSTLMSVISLGVFEHVSAYESFVRHVQGAAALVMARGKSQFSSPVGFLMFNQVRTDLVLASFRTEQPIPDKIIEMQEEALDHPCAATVSWRMGVLATRCARLLTDTQRNSVTGKRPWSELLDEAIILEQDFESLLPDLDIHEPFQTIRVSDGDPNIIFNGMYRLYLDSWSIRVWTNQRTLQMVTVEIKCFLFTKILSKTIPPDVRELSQLELRRSMQTLSNLGDNILAIVPQALEFISSESLNPCPSIGLASVSGGYILVWGLFMVGKSAATKSEARKWVLRLLQEIGWKTGISVALRLADVVREIDRYNDRLNTM